MPDKKQQDQLDATAVGLTLPAGQLDIDERNVEFWDTLCGASAARQLGITDHSEGSIRRSDEWSFGFYLYLFRHIPFDAMSRRRVLEVDGTVAQRVAESGVDYTGLDIADGPVAMAKSLAAA